ncbi:hypothetical protein BJ878DRAFT_484912 [Calycina marina]|uniref:Secreted protein n=1 Tax=Calycina marina TaxID=1763456 RepID=A0A9P7ZCK3_9HELO|nr:hypothetical protein BJ878DRAFT_484912 [Calycina marina]
MASSVFVSLLAPLVLLDHLTGAIPTAVTVSACLEIEINLPGQTYFPLSRNYISETQKYWSTALRDLQPVCVISPTSADQVLLSSRS